MMPAKTKARAIVRLLVFFVFMSLFYLACRNLSTEPVEDKPILAKDSIVALKVGNRWIWQIAFYDTVGMLHSTTYDSLRIDSVQVIGSEHWHFPGKPYEKLAFANLAGGCYYRAFSSAAPTSSFLFYKYPATLNESYKAPQGLVSGSRVWIVDTLKIMTVLSTDTTITVPAGTFRCYLYRYAWINGNFYSEEFLSPGRGWIRILGYTKLREGVYFKQSLKELIEFIPGS